MKGIDIRILDILKRSGIDNGCYGFVVEDTNASYWALFGQNDGFPATEPVKACLYVWVELIEDLLSEDDMITLGTSATYGNKKLLVFHAKDFNQSK